MTNEVILTPEIENKLSQEEKSLLRSEGFQITREIENLKVKNREQYEKACEIGIANCNALKKLEELYKALVKPLDLEKKRLKTVFDKAKEIFEANDEKIRKALEGYQHKVETDNIKTIHTDLGRATIQERKDWEIEDINLIPKEYFKLDEARIGQIIRAGGTVPGVKVKTVFSTAFVAA